MEKLSFRWMTFEILEARYGIREGERGILFPGGIEPVAPSLVLTETLARGKRVIMPNERARAYRLISPVLSEVETLRPGKVVALPEISIEVHDVEGLCGNPDFILSASMSSRVVPIAAIVEAKKDDTEPGLPQCVAELYAAYLLNHERPEQLYGCVTTGFDWHFIRFEGAEKVAYVDTEIYLLSDLARLLGVFRHIVDATLAALGSAGDRAHPAKSS
jgi:hypothetical protein